jgi:cell wall-associated NlpC family hydrolase
MPSYRRTLKAICGAALMWACASLHAAPELPTSPVPQQGDAVLQLLHDRGLLSSSAQNDANAVVRQVRDTASDLVLSAMNFLGVPYRRGGDSAEEGFDCSGFTRHIFELSLGLVLPRRADQQANQAGLLQVARDELKPGDLVFFNTMRRAFSHVGIYVGDGKFIHSPRAGGEVRVEDMRQAYWTKRFNGARRADAVAPQGIEALMRDTSAPAGGRP